MAHDVGMSPVRVLLLSNAITPDRPGGLERHVRELATALSRKGADVMIHARKVNQGDPQRCRDRDGVEIWRFQTPSKNNPLYALAYPGTTANAVRSAVRSAGKARVLHSHFPIQGLPLALGRKPYLHTFHSTLFRELIPERQGTYALPGPSKAGAVRLMRLCESGVLRRAGGVIVLSEFMRAEASALGADPDCISIVPGGVDTERFSPGPPIDDYWASGDGPLLFTARRFVPRTGVSELVEAFALISREIPNARLAVAGGGPLEGKIRDRIEALGLNDRVRMLGWIFGDDLVGWYRAADLVIMPTQELEGFGLATAEALACGTPVLGTPSGANPEVVRRLDASLITRDASPAAMAGKLTELLGDPARLGGLAARARAAVHPVLGWSSVADEYLALYERHQTEVAGAAGAGPRVALTRRRLTRRRPVSGKR
jgi:glycosyltransferase involved in cell wall biosynthesis